MSKKFSAVSLFTGAGGMDVGFGAAGFDVLWANELMPHAAATYDLNHPKGLMRQGDLNSFLDDLPETGTVDCVFGGPPCQGFSVAGKMDLNDQRSQLVFTYMDVVQRTMPSVFVLENVKALAALSKFAAVREELVRRASSMGYDARFYLLNAKDFGVPQSRERVFLIGFKRSLKISFNASNFDRYKLPLVPVRKIFESLGPAGTERNPHTCRAKITAASNPVMRKSPYAGMLFNGMGRPVSTDGVSCTLPASMGGNKTPIVDEGNIFRGEQNWVENYHAHLMDGGATIGMNEVPSHLRRLTINEAAAIQTFPLDYKFAGPISSQYTQIGNAVPCKLARAVAASVRDALLGQSPPIADLQKELEFALE